MKSIKMILIWLCVAMAAHSQSQYGQSWLIGTSGYSIKFDNNTILHDTNYIGYLGQFEFRWGNTNICDSNGDLRYVSDGYSIIHPDGSFVENGDTLEYLMWTNYSMLGTKYSQKSIFLPVENDKIYYINSNMSDSMFINNDDTNNINHLLFPYDRLTYSVIDGQANGGLGKVTQRMIPILQNKLLERSTMNACRHGNGKDWWLLKLAADSNDLYCIRLTQDSVVYERKLKLPFQFNATGGCNLGQLQFNNAGTQLVLLRPSFEPVDSSYYMLTADFDRCYGTISNTKKIKFPKQSYQFISLVKEDSTGLGVAFSPNGRFIYYGGGYYIMQYDQWDGTFYKVAEMDTIAAQFNGYNSLQLAPNGKIYIGHYHGGSRQFSVIDNPDAKGAACNFCRKCLRSQKIGFEFFNNVPHLPNYALGAVQGGCWPQSISQSAGVPLRQWAIFPNPASGLLNIKRDESEKEKLVFMNTQGQVVKEIILKGKETKVDISELAAGVYYVKMGGVVKKMVKE